MASPKILITGGSRGIGFSIANRLAKRGASCILMARNGDVLHEAMAKLPVGNGEGQKHSVIIGDVGSPEIWEEVRREYADIQTLINSAGISQKSLLISTPIQDVISILNTNLLGTTLACRAVAKSMMRRKSGCIVNIASVLAYKGVPGSSIYAASKAGIIGLTKSLAVELGQRNIRVNAICPGYIETEMTAGLKPEMGPSGRMGTPEEVAEVVEMVLENGYLNGAVIGVDGGLGCM
ncbi:hypothetical protein BZA77DRAFT_321875 [Pyronema omphalodes]|nr:hypothetical protein BZA77DRAFT_321875 [Pyronema omphalodes]